MSSLKEIPLLERPREKLKYFGVETLTNEELLTILIGSGNKYNSVKDLSVNILATLKDISSLNNITYQQLEKIKGLGQAKISILLSAVELSKRISNSKHNVFEEKITNSSILFDHYKNIYKGETQECFYSVYLDAAKKIIGEKLLFKGTLNRSLVHPREIFKEAYLIGASAFICVHNHPSGSVTPSKEDKNVTLNLKELGQLHGIPLVDHLIIGEDNYYSFYENGGL